MRINLLSCKSLEFIRLIILFRLYFLHLEQEGCGKMYKKTALTALIFLILITAFTPSFAAAKKKMTDEEFVEFCKTCSAKDIQQVIKSKLANVNARNKNELTPLIAASTFNKDTAVITALIKAKADVNASTSSGLTPLFGAAAMNSLSVVNVLLKAKANVNFTLPDGDTLLMGVIYSRAMDEDGVKEDPRIIEALIKAKANINAKNSKGKTALMTAAQWSNNVEVLKVLLKAKADKNASDNSGYTVIMHSVMNFHNNFDMLRTLISAGADMNAENKYGSTALDFAIGGLHYEARLILEEAGAKSNKF